MSRIQKETEKIIVKDNEIIFQKQDELEVGQNPDGSDIGEYAWESYEIFKRQINPLADGKVDLILTGSTKNKLRVKSLGNSKFTLYSTDPKWRGLFTKYGEQIGGISERAWQSLQKSKYAPELFEILRKLI